MYLVNQIKTKMKPKLYYMDVSPPVRSVFLTAKALNIELELISVNLLNGEHKTAEFKKLNPQATVPTLDDNGFIIWDSHAIISYLTEKHQKDDFLLPKDLQGRSIINQRLHFNGGVVQPRMRLILRRLFLGETKEISSDKAQDVVNAYEILEEFLKDESYMAGKRLTIADFSLVASISSLDPIIPIDSKKCPKLKNWLGRIQQLPYYNEANQIPLNKYIEAMKLRLKK